MSRFLIFIIVAISLSFTQEPQKTITWSKDRKLTWADYRGPAQRRAVAASTVYSLGRHVSEKNGAVIATIEAYFYCKDSWKRIDWINDEVLAHEQKHFDIVELFARRIRKQISGMTFIGIIDAKEKVESVYEELNKEMDAYQDKYDTESDGSMNGDGQHDWNEKIEKGLQALNQYSVTAVPLKIVGTKKD